MRSRHSLMHSLAIGLLLAAYGAAPALSAPDLTRTEIINEDDGFNGVCAAPCYSLEKVSDVYLDGNLTGPGVCGAGENTFVYTITHIGGTIPAPNIPLTEFEVTAPFSLVTSAGFIPGAGVAPTSTTISPLNVVNWAFPQSQSCPGCLIQGLVSEQLFICATGAAGSAPNNTSTTAIILDAPGECLAPIPGAPACDLEIDKTCCIPQPIVANDDICDSKIDRLVFEVVGGDCADGTNSQGGKAKCQGPNPIINPAVDEVDVTFLGHGSAAYVATPTNDIGVGETFEVTRPPGTLRSRTKFQLWGPGGDQILEVHTSCSKPIRCGDQFGALKVVEIETELGGTTVCGGGPVVGSACTSPGTPPGTSCDAKLVEAVFQFNPSDCQNPLGNPQNGEAKCDGDASDSNLPVSIRYTGKKKAKTTVSPSSGIQPGDTFRVTATGMKSLHPNVKLKIEDDDSVEQALALHVSCSQPLACGDVFGSLTLTGFTTKTGLEVDCSVAPPSPFQDTCECPVAPPTPHCTSRLEGLQLVYLKNLFGADCSVSNGQGGAASCTGDDLTAGNVGITILTQPLNISATPDMGIDEKDIFSIIKEVGGVKQQLPNSLSFTAMDDGGNSQTVQIHTSCSEELNLGDRFGDFAIFSMDRGDGDLTGGDSDDSDSDSDSDSSKGTSGEDGTISLGCQIEYQYKVTNPNGTAVENVMVDDDPHGLVVDGETLDPLEMKTFYLTKTLFETTLNEGMVTGDLVGGGQCEAATDDVTVTVTLPPQGSFSCNNAKPIDELSMEWGGGGSIRVRAWDGSPGGTLLADIDPVAPGDLVVVDGMGGSPNNQVWELFLPGTLTKIGESQFHISCSDAAMNGTEDCGNMQGNGKGDYPFNNNNWILEGMSGDETLACTPGVIPPTGGAPGCGLGAELVFLLPGLMWLARRRRS